MARMDWKRGRKFRGSEEKYEPGTVMGNGRVVPSPDRDNLAMRAAQAERDWLAGGQRAKAPVKPPPAASPAHPKSLEAKSPEGRLLHQVVMAVINAGQGDILKGIDDLNAYYNAHIPTVADIIGGRPETAIITGGITWDDKVYSFKCARTVNR